MRHQIMKPKHGVAWVTGASSGIGRDTALLLCKQGWTVAVTARRTEELDVLRRESEALKGTIVPMPGDVTDAGRMSVIVAEIEDAVGPVALAIMNAGIYMPVEAVDLDPGIFERSFRINVLGTVHGLQPVIPRMIERGRGHIAIVSSVTGYGGLPTSAAYGGTKAALNNMAECLKIELDRHQVRVSVICPGFVDTPAQAENEFAKPGIISSKAAARHIVNGLKSQKFEITFPWRFTFTLKLLKWLPRGFYTNLIKRRTGWDKVP